MLPIAEQSLHKDKSFSDRVCYSEPPVSRQDVDKSLGRHNEKPEYLTQTDQRVSYTLPCNVILTNRSSGCSLSKTVIAQTPSRHWSCLWGKINYCLFFTFLFLSLITLSLSQPMSCFSLSVIWFSSPPHWRRDWTSSCAAATFWPG